MDWLSDQIGLNSLLENMSLGRVRTLTRVQAKIWWQGGNRYQDLLPQ